MRKQHENEKARGRLHCPGYTIDQELRRLVEMAERQAIARMGGRPKMPDRIQRRRTAGWKMPPNTVYVGRGTRFGNPFRVGAEVPSFVFDYGAETPHRPKVIDADWAAWIFYACIERDPPRADAYEAWKQHGGQALHLTLLSCAADRRAALGGKNLACWCPLDHPCHADALLVLCNNYDPFEMNEVIKLLARYLEAKQSILNRNNYRLFDRTFTLADIVEIQQKIEELAASAGELSALRCHP